MTVEKSDGSHLWLSLKHIYVYLMHSRLDEWMERKMTGSDFNVFIISCYCRCRVDGCDPTGMETGDFEPEWLKHAIPWSDQTPKLLRQCKRFNETWSNTGECLTQNTSYDQVQLMNCDSGWVYDLSNFHTSIVTEVLLLPPKPSAHSLLP